MRPVQPPLPTPSLILIADSDDHSRNMLRLALQADRYRCEEAADGHQVLGKCMGLQPDLIVLDTSISGLNGFDLCNQLTILPRDIRPIVVLTSILDDEASIDRGFVAGAHDYVTKPICLPLIRHRIHNMLSSQQSINRIEEDRKLLFTLINTLPDYIYVKDVSSRFVVSNTAHARAAQASTAEELVGKTALELFPQELAQQYQTDDRIVIQTGEPLVNAERNTVDAEGNPRVVLTNKLPWRDSDGNILGLIGISRDITGRELLVKALQDAEAKERGQRMLAEALHDIAKSITSTLQLKEVIARILDHASRVLPHDTANIMLIEGNIAHTAYWRGYPTELDRLIQTFAFSLDRVSNLRQMKHTGLPCLIADTSLDQNWVALPKTPPVASYIGAPIQIQGEIIGFLNLNSQTPRFFTAEYLPRLQSFADLAAIAIQNAKLYERLRVHATSLEEHVEQRTAELRDLKEQVEAILNHSSDAIVVTQLDGRLQTINRAYKQTFRQGSDSLFSIVQPEDVETVRQALASVDVNHMPVRVEILAVGNDGLPFNAELALAHIAGQKQWNIVCNIRDISERKLTEKSLAYERDLLKALMDHIPDAIFFKDSHSRYIRINKAQAKLLGISDPAMAIGKTDFDFQPPHLAQECRTEEQWLLENRLPIVDRNSITVAQDGREYHFSTTKVPILDADVNVVCIIGISRDVTERKRIEEQRLELALAQKRTEDLNSISHDLKTPLAVINTSIYLLEKLTDPPKQKEQLSVIREQVTRLARLIHEILEISRLDTVPRLTFRPLDTNKLVREAYKELRVIAFKKRLTVNLDLASDLPPIVGDEDSLDRVMVNLIENALNYTPMEGTILIQNYAQEGHIVIEVQDSGIGISEVDLPQIFERFYRANNARAIHSGGTGLGLSIVKRIVEIHSGKIEVLSHLGVGATFRVRLPFHPRQPTNETDELT